MKNARFKLFIGLVAATALTFSACTDDTVETSKPKLNFLAGDDYVSADGDILAGSEFTVGLNASHDKKIEKLEVTVSYDGNPATAPLNCTLCDTTINETSFTIDFTNMVSDKPGTETWNFTVIDVDGNSTTKSITFNRTAVPKAVRTISVTLGNQNSATLGSSLNLNDMSVNLLADARANSANIDLIYVVDGNGASFIGAPSSDDINAQLKVDDWTTRNATMLRATNFSVADFSGMSDSKELLAEVTSSAATANILEVSGGYVFFVKPVSTGGRYCLIKVNSIGVDNTISLDVLVEED